MKQYMYLSPYLIDGTYRTVANPSLVDRLKLKLAQWLYESVQKHDEITVITTAGASCSRSLTMAQR